ncbi:MAG: HEAT repeat domain-containing protein [Anaerolineales bacterium]
MAENEPRKPEEVLNEVLGELQSENPQVRLQAISKLSEIKYSSVAIRTQLEKMALHDPNKELRKIAATALSQPIQRFVQSRLNKIERGNRYLFLQEIAEWEKNGLIQSENAEVIRQRYDFDFTPPPAAAQPAPVSEKAPAPQPIEPAPATPQPEPIKQSLLQSLLSETSIKIFLYLGAFFVIASATILGAAVPEARLPVLIIGTILFGGLSIAIKKRLPQPSFALFIVFSFLLPITANVIENTFNLPEALSAGYWVIVFLIMSLIWAGSTWLYESRLFSITAFMSIALAFYRLGDVFSAKAEVYFLLMGISALVGLGGVWLVKKWKGENFTLPLFVSAQIVQIAIIFASMVLFIGHMITAPEQPLWNLVSLLAWGLAFIFYGLSNSLIPFPLFPWMAMATLISFPWLIGAAFKLEYLGNALVFFGWGFVIATASEITYKFKRARKYSVPALLVTLPTLGVAIIYGYLHTTELGMGIVFGIGLIYTILHAIRTRSWLWALALLNLSTAYFSFFNLSFMEKIDIPFGYQLLFLSILFLLPEIVFKDSQPLHRAWRTPPRIFGILVTTWASFLVLFEDNHAITAITFVSYTILFALITLRQRKGNYGYLPTAYLSLAIYFTLDYAKLNYWLLALTLLSIAYFVIGVVIKYAFPTKENLTRTLRYSALILGTLISFFALSTLREYGGWSALVIGLLFALEMYLSRDGIFEPGLPILFNVGAFLLFHDLKVEITSYYLLTFSVVWIISDLFAHLTFTESRPLKLIVRGLAVLLTSISFELLFFGKTTPGVIGFGIYTILFLIVTIVYRKPLLLYTFTATLPLFITFLFREFDLTKWIHPVIFVAIFYYVTGFALRKLERAKDWDVTLLMSGLGLSLIVSLGAPSIGGIDAAIPVAIAATLWAFEALAKKNVWLGLPSNGLYLLAYFIILYELKVDQPQFYSIGAALLGLFQHYLLTRAGSKTGAFLMGTVSQLVLLGTTYIQLTSTDSLLYFVALFFQSIAVLIYGLVIRSRSLTFMPIIMVVLGVVTVVYSKLQGLNTVLIIGCTGMLLLVFGILAVVMRERITKLGERLSSWKA